MAFTYLILNLIFCIAIGALLVRHLHPPSKTWWLTLAALVMLTAIFDNVIIWAGIVAYDPTKILRVFVGHAPIEDFFYAMLSVIIVPILWKRFKR